MKPAHILAAIGGAAIVAGWTIARSRTQSAGMGTATLTTSTKTIKRPKRLHRRLKIDPSKPVQGQGIGTATLAADYDPVEPAYPASYWKHLAK